jgi:hypothetical protein
VQHGQAKVAAHHGDIEDDRLFGSYVVLFLMQRHDLSRRACTTHMLSTLSAGTVHIRVLLQTLQKPSSLQLVFELVVDDGLLHC